jgi:DNA polymerase-4
LTILFPILLEITPYLSYMKHKDDYFSNSTDANKGSFVMYIDMNSYFASCEQQRHPELRDKPLGVLTYDSPNAAVIAASIEAKRLGVKTGMRLGDCKLLCPQMLTTTTHPGWYRQIHVEVMNILRSYCDDVIPKSIDEAVVNFNSYRLVYKDLTEVARQIKADITRKYDYLKCSIGIAPNSFLAKVGTELQKPDGLVVITHDNIDEHLAKMKLTDLPGIAGKNEHRLMMIGIRTPVEMRHSSPALLRKAFGGIVGNYWHSRLNFAEIDMYSKAENRTMSATRTMSRQQSSNPQALESMLISLCTRLEQRLVKSNLFCKEIYFSIRYRDGTRWETTVKLADPVQDAVEMISYIKKNITEFEQSRKIATVFTPNTTNIGVAISSFMNGQVMQYNLFDNRIKKDTVRRVMYQIKDHFEQKNIVRKGFELYMPNVMKDAIGFGSVRDMAVKEKEVKNKYMLEEEEEPGVPKKEIVRRKPATSPPQDGDEAYRDYDGPVYADVQFD